MTPDSRSSHRILAIGEAMIEISGADLRRGTADLGVAGDTLNTAVYLARLFQGTATSVSYLTVLGQDALSDAMIDWIEAEGIATRGIARHRARLPGLYAIERDTSGERRFHYWRAASAARTLFEGGRGVDEALAVADVIILSGITLAILAPEARATLIAGCAAARDQGKIVVFDSNYRPALWASADTARAAHAEMWGACTLALPSADDEALLHGGETPEDTIARIATTGVVEIALKRGAAGPLIWHGGSLRRGAFAAAARVVDTTAAGDSFNTGYLHARLCGATPEDAASAGHALACHVVGHPGAIVPLPQGTWPGKRSS